MISSKLNANKENFCEVLEESLNFAKTVKSWSLRDKLEPQEELKNKVRTTAEEMRERRNILDDGCKRNGSILEYSAIPFFAISKLRRLKFGTSLRDQFKTESLKGFLPFVQTFARFHA